MGPTRSRMVRFDAHAEIDGGEERALAADEAAGHLVDGADGGDGHAAFDGFDDAVMVFGVELVARLDENDVGAETFGVGDDGSGAHAEGLGLVAGGDAAGGVGHHGHHAHGTAAQLRPRLLLARGEVGVEIDEEPVERGILRGFRGGRLLRLARGAFCNSAGPGSQVLQATPRERARRPDWGPKPYVHYFRFLFSL